MKLDKPNDIKINFIIGSGRSGTTLLTCILNNHKNCISTPETKHLLFFYKKYHNIAKVNQSLIDDLKNYFSIMLQSEGVADYKSYLNVELLHLKLGDKISYFEICQKIYFAFANPKKDTSKISCIVDKNPSYTLNVDELNTILPDAKYLCLIRDYRSFVLSNIESPEPYAKHLPVQYHSIVWMFYNKLVYSISKKYGDKVSIITYEELVSHKEPTFNKICSFFDIEYDENCFKYQTNVDLNEKINNKDKRLADKATILAKPINTSRVEAWKDIFSDFKLKIIEFWCGKIGTKFGYKTTKKINWIESIIIWTISLPYYVRVWLYFKLKSVRLNVFLNEGRKAKYFKDLYNNS